MKKVVLSILILTISLYSFGQTRLQPGFDAEEYRMMLRLAERQIDSLEFPYKLDYPIGYQRVYQSEIVGLDNRWSLWVNKSKGQLVVCIRATTMSSESWLENFYSGMIPAKGKLKIDSSGYFNYKVADDSTAYVHAGWMIGTAALAPDIVSKLREYYDMGYRNTIIFGHSQGGGIAFLVRSYIEYMDSPLPPDMLLKTYCSAAPKPGNLYYAYDFDRITFGGWGLRVVNTLDWVPEVPFGIQSLNDANEINPFANVNEAFKTIPVYQKIYLKSIYRKLDKSTMKAQKRYTKYMGIRTYELVKSYLPESEIPEFTGSYSYITAGTPVILRPGQAYLENYVPSARQNIGLHHFFYPYYLVSLEVFPERD